jgi:uncharacterized delta-60 repeat protein
MIPQPDYKLFVGGYFGTVRFNENGSLDNSFGVNGKAGQSKWFLKHAAVQPDGKIIVGGFKDTTPSELRNSIFLMRYNSNGSIDNSFGNSGMVYTPKIGTTDVLNRILIQPGGKFYVAGTTMGNNNQSHGALLMRYNANGVLDQTFGIRGKVKTGFGSYNQTAGAIIQPDGKIVLAGGTYSCTISTCVLHLLVFVMTVIVLFTIIL